MREPGRPPVNGGVHVPGGRFRAGPARRFLLGYQSGARGSGYSKGDLHTIGG
ncbi:hypothetical protein HNR23_003734 [Nocardiopsis mwathae]|uniref:Uncharacterized protein n=1 Tax=Nocardiopsis mwathae TaxID=1472723 RepID=A0A7X0D856_9ACTN|nr:hypothetical protein [Nocardiopsis mwathae]